MSPRLQGGRGSPPADPRAGTGRDREGGKEGRKERKGERESWRAEEGGGTALVLGSGAGAAADFRGGGGAGAEEGARGPGVHPRGSSFAAQSRP